MMINAVVPRSVTNASVVDPSKAVGVVTKHVTYVRQATQKHKTRVVTTTQLEAEWSVELVAMGIQRGHVAVRADGMVIVKSEDYEDGLDLTDKTEGKLSREVSGHEAKTMMDNIALVKDYIMTGPGGQQAIPTSGTENHRPAKSVRSSKSGHKAISDQGYDALQNAHVMFSDLLREGKRLGKQLRAVSSRNVQ